MIGFMGGFGGNNLGDELIALVNYMLANNIGLNKEDIYFFSFNKIESMKNFPDINWIEYNKLPDLFNKLKNISYLKTNKNLFKNFNKIILGAGGLFYDYRMFHLIGWYSRVSYLNNNNIPYSLFGVSLQKSYNLLGRKLVRYILANSSYNSFRDSLSIISAQKLVKGIYVDKIIDPVFYLKKVLKINKLQKFSKVLIAPRRWKNFNNLYKDLIEYLLKNKIEFDFWALDLREDIDFCKKLQNMFNLNNQILQTPIKIGLNKIFEIINNYEYIIGVRFHSIVIASILGKKIIAIPYDLKVNGLMKDLYLSKFLYTEGNINQFLDKSFNEWYKKGKDYIDLYSSYINDSIPLIEESFEKAIFS
ncbi:MAG TPA: polysaccharide pyruvyl transferase family protein [Persephonella sp.]|nr:polysaccharide pyruvyl transferase family protein [Hydrogenothermaceae bacterium]HIQ25630.1 polysaccharide pyruvyl transferase family protein [Persephonella sp.]